jgi:cytochrome bd-type quinol oxidase subunit 2
MVVLTYPAGFVILEKEKPMVMLASSASSLVMKKVKPMVMVASFVISFVLEKKKADGGSTPFASLFFALSSLCFFGFCLVAFSSLFPPVFGSSSGFYSQRT